MSASLKWYQPPTARTLLGRGGTGLKCILAKRFCGMDGSSAAEFTLDGSDTTFVEGLAAAGVEGAEKLLMDLELYGSLELEISD